ncbi:antigen 5 like allergen Cul n 1-like [Episyrphus balteatus]|uniref:antigen 5 like allergen Cul n 1-like n=1 Tax=Episyrphus balteatus TaxID=286459 RepID=UPI0024864C87|nr:antigen 5 like allergen Cul n 1-like [Episyrphus balteatus]
MIPEITFLIIFLNLANSYEYCNKETKVCMGNTKRHIVCFKEQITPEAEYQKHYPMTDLFRNWILYWHNYYRNEVACGKAQGSEGYLPRAFQMRELAWDYELEYIASIHAGRCKMQHDQCRNTERIPISGQNLAYHKTTGPPRKALDRAQISIYNWYKECQYIPESIIHNYGKIDSTAKIGHFTVLSNDKVGRVGCAMTFCTSFPDKDEKWVYNFLTCNYDYTNVPGYPVYKIGNTRNCDGFNGEISSNFSCLCAKSY